MLITIGTPNNGHFAAEYIQSRTIMLMQPLYDYEILSYEGCYIHSNRNLMMADAKGEYLLFIDSDMQWDQKNISALVNLDKDIAGALYYKRRHPYGPVVYGHNGLKFEPLKQIPERAFQCAGIGTGFLLISRKVIEEFKKPENHAEWGHPFDYLRAMHDGNTGSYFIGEDLSFCAKAKHLGFEIWCDPENVVGHVGSQIVRTP